MQWKSRVQIKMTYGTEEIYIKMASAYRTLQRNSYVKTIFTYKTLQRDHFEHNYNATVMSTWHTCSN